jgi:hypothetical protein
MRRPSEPRHNLFDAKTLRRIRMGLGGMVQPWVAKEANLVDGHGQGSQRIEFIKSLPIHKLQHWKFVRRGVRVGERNEFQWLPYESGY